MSTVDGFILDFNCVGNVSSVIGYPEAQKDSIG